MVVDVPADGTIIVAESATLKMPCGAAAPLVANGAVFIGCSLSKGHEGQHEVTVKWQ